MDRPAVAVVGVVAVLLAALTGGLVFGPADLTAPAGDEEAVPPTADPSPDDAETAPTTASPSVVDDDAPGTATDAGDSGNDVAAGPGSPDDVPDDAAATDQDRPYSVTVDGIASCGLTCRDVTATLTNTGDTLRENVSVVTRVSTGGEQVWKGSQRVGALAPGERHTITRRVELSPGEALAVEGNDGYVTIETTVRSDSGAVTFTDRRRAA
jgi:hypothetical protein